MNDILIDSTEIGNGTAPLLRAAGAGQPMPGGRKPARCLCGAWIHGDIEGHRAEVERTWIALGNDPADRCLCLPCADHSLDRHLDDTVTDFEREEDERRQDERTTRIIREEVGRALAIGREPME